MEISEVVNICAVHLCDLTKGEVKSIVMLTVVVCVWLSDGLKYNVRMCVSIN